MHNYTLCVHVGQRQSRQEQDLNKKLVSLEAQLALMQSEVDSLNDQNIRKQETINSLQANVLTNEGNTDINGYLDKIVELTTRLTDIEEEEKKQRLKNAELELQLSKSKTLAQFVKQLSTQRDQLTSEVKQLTAALEEEKTRQPLSVDSIQAASLTDDKLHLRVLTEEAVKVPEFQREIIDLKKKAESFEEVAKQCSDQLLDKVTEVRISVLEIIVIDCMVKYMSFLCLVVLIRHMQECMVILIKRLVINRWQYTVA